jgi:hypothetical protein
MRTHHPRLFHPNAIKMINMMFTTMQKAARGKSRMPIMVIVSKKAATTLSTIPEAQITKPRVPPLLSDPHRRRPVSRYRKESNSTTTPNQRVSPKERRAMPPMSHRIPNMERKTEAIVMEADLVDRWGGPPCVVEAPVKISAGSSRPQ